MTYILYNAYMLNHYAKKYHARAVAKGFWDEPHSVGHYLMLAFGELHEAIEADRIGKWAKLDPNTIGTLHSIEGAIYIQEFLRLVKDTVEDEIADAVIRMLDLLGWIIGDKALTSYQVNSAYGVYGKEKLPAMLTDALMPIVAELCGASAYGDVTTGILNAIKSLEQLCDHLGIDLMAHIDLKLKYNETRPALHGKKY